MKEEIQPMPLSVAACHPFLFLEAVFRQIEVSVFEKNCPSGIAIEDFSKLSVLQAMQIIQSEKNTN